MNRPDPRIAGHCSLVTGGAGFLGRALVGALLERGGIVRALILPEDTSLDDLVRRHESEGRFTVFRGDVADADAISTAFEAVDDVYHAAALVHAWAPRERFDIVNVKGTRNVAELALAHGVRRLIAISTSDVFGMPQGNRVLDESGPYRYWGEPYPDSKIDAERWLWRLHRESGLPLTVIYPGWVYGPGDRAFFPGLAAAITAGQMFFWFRNAKLPFVYIDNLVDACLLAAERADAVGQGYIVHDGDDGPTLEELCAAIAAQLGVPAPRKHLPYRITHGAARMLQALWRWRRASGPPPLRTVDVKAFGMQFRLSNAKVRRELGWEPRVSSAEGMRRALEYLRGTTPGAGAAS